MKHSILQSMGGEYCLQKPGANCSNSTTHQKQKLGQQTNLLGANPLPTNHCVEIVIGIMEVKIPFPGYLKALFHPVAHGLH